MNDLVVVSGFLLAVIVFLLADVVRERKAHKLTKYFLANTEASLDRSYARSNKTDDTLIEVFLLLSPLVAKTDWMTGRWGGQFNRLVTMENDRNLLVDTIRRQFMESPVIADYLTESVKGARHGSP